MAFSDDDLKRLKKAGAAFDLSYDGLLALLSRLEAAEKVIQGHVDLEVEHINYDDFVTLLNAWRKACGK